MVCASRQASAQRDAAGRHRFDRGRQRVPASVHGQLQPALCQVTQNEKDVHRPLRPDDQLDDASAWKEERTVSKSLTLQYDQVLFILEPSGITRPLARKRVTVFDYPDGRLAIRNKGVELPYLIFDRQQRVDPAAVVDNKRLGAVLSLISERQTQVEITRSKKAPRGRGQSSSLSKAG